LTTLGWFATYLIAGTLAILLLDLTTGRISRNLKSASCDTQEILAKAGLIIPPKASLIIITVVLWLFWPLAIYGAVETMVKDASHSKEESHDKNKQE